MSTKALSSRPDVRVIWPSFVICYHGQHDVLRHLGQLMRYDIMVSMMHNSSRPADALCHNGQHDAQHLLGQVMGYAITVSMMPYAFSPI